MTAGRARYVWLVTGKVQIRDELTAFIDGSPAGRIANLQPVVLDDHMSHLRGRLQLAARSGPKLASDAIPTTDLLDQVWAGATARDRIRAEHALGLRPRWSWWGSLETAASYLVDRPRLPQLIAAELQMYPHGRRPRSRCGRCPAAHRSNPPA